MVVNYNNDDPFGGSEGRSWDTYLGTLNGYDLLVVMRTMNVDEAKARGAREAMRVFMSYDEVAHAPSSLTREDVQRWSSDVSFVGTWRPERGPFLAALIDAGVPLSFWGGRWDRAPEWRRLQSAWRGPNLVGSDYAKAIQCSKVAIGLVSKGNRDEHTQRSMEIPALGTVLCAERTAEHAALFRDGIEVLLWSTVDECARLCTDVVRDAERRSDIARAGQARVVSMRAGNEPTVTKILARALELSRDRSDY